MTTYYIRPSNSEKKKYIVWKKTSTPSGETHEAMSGHVSKASANLKIQKLQKQNG